MSVNWKKKRFYQPANPLGKHVFHELWPEIHLMKQNWDTMKFSELEAGKAQAKRRFVIDDAIRRGLRPALAIGADRKHPVPNQAAKSDVSRVTGCRHET